MKPTVAMVDDETDYTTLLGQWIEPLYDFHAYAGAEDFLRAAPALSPDVAILDLYLPGIDGFELCRRLHALPGLETVPVLFLTGSQKVEDYRKSMAAGGDSFLMKPVSRAQLMAAIAYLLPRPSLRDDGD